MEVAKASSSKAIESILPHTYIQNTASLYDTMKDSSSGTRNPFSAATEKAGHLMHKLVGGTSHKETTNNEEESNAETQQERLGTRLLHWLPGIGGHRDSSNPNERKPLLPLVAVKRTLGGLHVPTRRRTTVESAGGASSRSVHHDDEEPQQDNEKSDDKSQTLTQFGTMLGSDVSLTVGVAALLALASCLFLPSPGIAAAFFACFVMGYSTGRWQVKHAVHWERQQEIQDKLDHREALRPIVPQGDESIVGALGHHTMLNYVIGRKRLAALFPRERLRSFMRRRSVHQEIGDIEEGRPQAGESSPTVLIHDQFGRILLAPPPVETSKLPSQFLSATPLCASLQGMDIFATDAPVERVGTHAAFVASGLRDQPVFILNGLTHVGNFLLYFALPDWVNAWDGISPATDADSSDIATLKSFLSASDAKRNERLKVCVSVNQGPVVVLAVAPSSDATFGVVGPINPGTWHYYHAATHEEDGRELKQAWELEVNLADDKFCRYGISILKRNMHLLVLDVCFLLASDEAEGSMDKKSTVLACFRLDHVDMQRAPDFPIPPTPEEDLRMIQRASPQSMVTNDDKGSDAN